MAAPVLKFKRGLLANLPALNAGEPGFTTDNHDLFIGSAAGNKIIGSGRFWTTETSSTGGAVRVYEATANGTNSISFAAPANIASDVTYTFPSSPTNNFFLKTNSSGTLSWAEVTTSFTIAADSGTADSVSTGQTITFAGTANEINTTVSDNQITIGMPNDIIVGGGLTVTNNLIVGGQLRGPAEFIIDPAAVGDNTGAVRIKGDLFVDGTQTIINSSTIELADFVVGIASTATTDLLADGAGIKIGPDNTLLYDHTNTALKSSENFNLTSGKTYKINGTDVLSSTTLGSGVVNSSLTSVGTLTALSVSGTLGVTGATTLSSTLGVTGATTLSSTLGVTGNTTLTGLLDANGGAEIDNIRIGVAGDNEIDTSTGNLTIDSAGGTTTLDDNVSVSGTLGVTGPTTLSSTLAVTGISTFTGALDANGGADISGGETTLSSATISDLTSGRVVLAGTSGAIQDSANLTFGGGGLIVGAGGINVTGVSTFSTTVNITGLLSSVDVNVSGAATVVGNLKIGSLKVNDAAGNSDVIRHDGTVRILENITVDAGSF